MISSRALATSAGIVAAATFAICGVLVAFAPGPTETRRMPDASAQDPPLTVGLTEATTPIWPVPKIRVFRIQRLLL